MERSMDWQQRLGDLPQLRSVILDDGRYVPGLRGQQSKRVNNTNDLFARHPELRQRFKEDFASWRFFRRQLLRFQDAISDGFRARFSKEILLVDAREDASLRRFLLRLRTNLPGPAEPLKERVRAVAMAVVDTFGGNADGSTLMANWERRLEELQAPPPADVPIGELMMGSSMSGRRRPGAGVCRHRAILLKYVCDTLGLVDCALLTGVVVPAGTRSVHRARKDVEVDHMWNVVRIDGRPLMVDCMFFPGDLWDAEDLFGGFIGEHMEYHRIGGQAGVFSLDREASRARRSTAAAHDSASIGPSFFPREEAQVQNQDSDPDEAYLSALMKASLEQFGDVELLARGPPCACALCGERLDGQRVRLYNCRHTLHIECLLQSWADGRCPACGMSFAHQHLLLE